VVPVRVIGGRSRGRRLSGRLPAGVRPTADRVREAIFDVLGSMGGVADLAVVDLFCGSGAMGVEALSRGAASATFVDCDPAALEAVRTNLRAVGLAGEAATVLRAELPAWLERAGRFDLAFCDPPYTFEDWDLLLGWLQADLAVLESGAEIAVPEGWEVTRSRRYGGTLVTVVRQTSSPSVIGS
jgi:16S rRNA (guanine966-N2)-methyltransferase